MFKSKDILEIDFVSGFGAQQGTFIVTRVTSPKGYYKKINLKVYKDGKVKKGGVAFALVARTAGDSPIFAIGDLAVYNFKVKLLGNQKTGMIAQAEDFDVKPIAGRSQNVSGTPVKLNQEIRAYSFEKQNKVLEKLLSATVTDPALVVNIKTVDFLNTAVNRLFIEDDIEDLTFFSGEPIGFQNQIIGYKLDMLKSLSSDDIIQLLAFIRCLGFQIVNVDRTDNQINYSQPKAYNIAKVINSLVHDPEGAREGLDKFGMYFLPMENNYSRPLRISVDWSEAAAKYSSKTAQIAEETVETTTDVPEPVETPSQAIEEPVRAKQNLDYYQLLWYEGEQFDFLPDDTKIYTPWALTRVLEFLATQAPSESDEAGYNKVKILTHD
jgi:hypothetical protein